MLAKMNTKYVLGSDESNARIAKVSSILTEKVNPNKASHDGDKHGLKIQSHQLREILYDMEKKFSSNFLNDPEVI